MNEKQINEHLKNGIYGIAPDCMDTIWERIETENKEKIPFWKKWTNTKVNKMMPAIACLCVVAGIYGGYQYNVGTVSTVVELDVNPSIEFGVNKLDKVIKVKALNSDGEEVIENLSLEKMVLEDATLCVMDEMMERGFLTQEKATVLVSVENKSEKKTTEIKENLSEKIEAHLDENDIEITVLKQTIEEDEVSKNIEKEYNISLGKATLVKTLVEENPKLKEEKLATMTVDEIVKEAAKEAVDVKSVLDKKEEIALPTSTKKPTKGVNDINEEGTKGQKPTSNSTQEEKAEGTKKQSKGEKPVEDEYPTEQSRVTQTPQATEHPRPTKAPQVTDRPRATDKPRDTKEPKATDKPRATKAPQPTEQPRATNAPKVTDKPKATKAPQPTEQPRATKAPKVTDKPKATKVPQPTEQPRATKAPKITDKPKATKAPQPTEQPRATKAPKVTEQPKATKAPQPTEEVKPTREPQPTQEPQPTEFPNKQPDGREDGDRQPDGREDGGKHSDDENGKR